MSGENVVEVTQNAEYEKMFLEKLTLLNRTFLRVIEGCVKEMPDADLSPTVRDYLNHVMSLDEMYGSKSGEESVKKRRVKVGRRSRKRQAGSKALPGNTLEKSTFKKPEESPSDADSTANKSLAFVPHKSVQPPPSQFSFGGESASKTSFFTGSDSGRRNRKRANIDSLEEAETAGRNLKNKSGFLMNTSVISEKGNGSKIDSPKQSPAVLNPVTAVKEDAKNSPIIFGTSDKPTFSMKSQDSISKPPQFLFVSAAKQDDAEEKDDVNKSGTGAKFPTMLSFGNTSSGSTAASTLTFGSAPNSSSGSNTLSFGFGKSEKETGEKSGTITGGSSTLFAIGKSQDGDSKVAPDNSMQSTLSTSTPKTDGPPKLIFAFKGGNSGTSDFHFTKPLVSEATSEKEEEYVPPKPEAVIQDEPDAVLSTKCSVFVLKGKEYEKIGIGQLHIKKGSDDEKKILLIRAATTIATVWVNSFIDKNTKCSKVDDTKLRVGCINGTTASTYLIRFPNPKTREEVEGMLSES